MTSCFISCSTDEECIYKSEAEVIVAYKLHDYWWKMSMAICLWPWLRWTSVFIRYPLILSLPCPYYFFISHPILFVCSIFLFTFMFCLLLYFHPVISFYSTYVTLFSVIHSFLSLSYTLLSLFTATLFSICLVCPFRWASVVYYNAFVL